MHLVFVHLRTNLSLMPDSPFFDLLVLRRWTSTSILDGALEDRKKKIYASQTGGI